MEFDVHCSQRSRMGYCHWEDHRPTNGIEKGTRGGLAISFSGCDDDQTSADTYALARVTTTGAMTYAFIKAVASESAPTYGSLLLTIRTAIRFANAGILASGPIASLIKKVPQFGLTQELTAHGWGKQMQQKRGPHRSFMILEPRGV